VRGVSRVMRRKNEAYFMTDLRGGANSSLSGFAPVLVAGAYPLKPLTRCFATRITMRSARFGVSNVR
jgi:hypothetical protein